MISLLRRRELADRCIFQYDNGYWITIGLLRMGDVYLYVSHLAMNVEIGNDHKAKYLVDGIVGR